MLTTDLALIFDPDYEKISRRLFENPDGLPRFCKGLVQADARGYGAMYTLLGPGSPSQAFLWQNPIPAVDHPLVDEQDVMDLKT